MHIDLFMCNRYKVNLIIRGELCEPPSSISCFRDVTLYSSCFVNAPVLLETPRGMKDNYYTWLKNNGAYDFIEEIIERNEDYGFKIGPTEANLKIDRIIPENLNLVIGVLQRL